MQIRVQNIRMSLADALRRCGYGFERQHPSSAEVSAARKMARGDFPRFHIYAKMSNDRELIINLHLDQKRPSYGHHTAHSGEYDGPLIDEELKRVQNIITKESQR